MEETEGYINSPSFSKVFNSHKVEKTDLSRWLCNARAHCVTEQISLIFTSPSDFLIQNHEFVTQRLVMRKAAESM